tara:strand:- start:4428 stop:7100 length:2673 start_codon:yes stop_codon:yes gene_type:complete
MTYYNRFVVIGCGGREHAILAGLKRTRNAKKSDTSSLFLSAVGTWRNLGIIKIVSEDNFLQLPSITSPESKEIIAKWCRSRKIEVAIIGPEAPLQIGIVNLLKSQGIKCIGPTSKLARIETSKKYCRQLLSNSKNALNDYNPAWFYFTKELASEYNWDDLSIECLQDLIISLLPSNSKYVIKAIGLKGGKGVWVQGDHFNEIDEAYKICSSLYITDGEFIIEEKLIGHEFSCFTLACQSGRYYHLPIVQDYKRALDGNFGPNTGGMGSVMPPVGQLPKWLSNSDVSEVQMVNNQVLRELSLNNEEERYVGILYGSFIKTDEGKLKVIEYNARFGDPEVLNILEVLKTDHSLIYSDMVCDEGVALLDNNKLEFDYDKWVLCRYLCPQGYPTRPDRGMEVGITSSIINPMRSNNTSVYFASAEFDHYFNGLKGLEVHKLLGSRGIAIVTSGEDLETAIKYNNEFLNNNIFKNAEFLAYRNDIGYDFLPVDTFNNSKNNHNGNEYSDNNGNANMTYEDAGVNIDEGNRVVSEIKDYVVSTHNDYIPKEKYGGFGGCYKILNQAYDKYLYHYGDIHHSMEYGKAKDIMLVTSMDGVGTKVQTVLNLMPRELGWESLGQDLFSSNVNDILCLGPRVRPLFFMDYFGCNKLDSKDVKHFVKGLTDQCNLSDCVLIGGETAELPDFSDDWDNYHRRHAGMEPLSKLSRKNNNNNYELVGNVVGIMDNGERFRPDNLKAGNLVCALKSSGPHTNGYSLINRLITSDRINRETVLRLAPIICAPHRNYYTELSMVWNFPDTKVSESTIKGLCHITGGGLVDNPPRVLPEKLDIEWGEWEIPEVFRVIQEASGCSDEELRRTYNCGLGMLVFVNNDNDYMNLRNIWGEDFLLVGKLKLKK